MPTLVVEQTLPDVSNMLAVDAADALQFVLATPFFLDPVVSATVGAGRVISQDPPAGTLVTERINVTLAMSSGNGSNWRIFVERRIGA